MAFPKPVKFPNWLKWFHPLLTWDRYDTVKGEKVIYLTFDDGPIPEVTPWVLSLLDQFGAKATFFCIGENVAQNPNVLKRVLAEGHQVGNHTFNHLNGRKVSFERYLKNVDKASEVIAEVSPNGSSELFRPPYGKIKRKTARFLKNKGFEIIMYDLIAYDWQQDVDTLKVLESIKKRTRPGSIIVMHDSLKAEEKLKVLLPEILGHFKSKGYRFEAL